MRRLQDNGGTAQVSLPKEKLELDALVAADGSIADRCLDVLRLGERCYCVRIADAEGELPTIARSASEQITSEGALEATVAKGDD